MSNDYRDYEHKRLGDKIDALSVQPTVRISLKKSSSKDGQEGWDIDVTSDAKPEHLRNALAAALEARHQLRTALGLGDGTDYVSALEAIVAAEGA